MTEEKRPRKLEAEEPRFTPSSYLLKKWAQEREDEEAVTNQSDPMNPRNWGKLIIDSYLDSWYNLNPGLYHLFHRDYKAVGIEMVSALRYERPGIFERIWEDLAEKEFEAWSPPRPKF